MYPSEYAYHDNSVSRDESPSASCRRYEDTFTYSGQYTHCDGRQLKLIDSELGPEQYQPTDYYVWIAGSDGKLLFIFPTRVSLTTITLHYYSDNAHHLGLPRLRFYAVLDDFDVWDAPDYKHTTYADVSMQFHQGESQQVKGMSASKRQLQH